MNDDVTIISIEKVRRGYKIYTTIGEYTVDEDILVSYNITKSAKFSKVAFDKIIYSANINKFFLKVLNYLSYGLRSEVEINKYLSKDELAPDIIDAVIARLKEFGYIDDERLAKLFVESESEVRRRGPKHIYNKLFQKGVDKEIITQALLDYEVDLQRENIVYHTTKELKLKRKYPPRRQHQLITNKLLRLGFDYQHINEHLSTVEFIDESDEQLQKDLKRVVNRYSNSELSNYEQRQRVINSLLRRGYEYQKITKYFKSNE